MATKENRLQPGVERALIVFALVLVCASFVVRWLSAIDHDVAHFLALAQMVSDGRDLYDDLLDQNTPGAVLLGRFSIAVSQLLSAAPDHCHLLVITAVVLAACLLSLSVVRRLGGRAVTTAFLVSSAAAFFFLASRDFGRREHLFAACFLPYVLAVAGRLHGRGVPLRTTLSVGVAAALGLFMKPYFVLFALAVVGYEWVAVRFEIRRLSAETWCTAALALSAYGLFLVLEPNYLRTIVPYTVATFLQYRGSSLAAVMANASTVLGAALALLAIQFLGCRRRQKSLASTLCRLGWPLLAAGVVIVGVQGFGFYYHALPLRLWSFLGASTFSIVVLLQLLGGEVNNSGVSDGAALGAQAPRVALVLALLAATVVTLSARSQVWALSSSPRGKMIAHPLVQVLRLNPRPGYTYIFSSSVLPGGLAFVYADTLWSGHMIPMYMLPIIADFRADPSTYPTADATELSAIEASVRSWIVDDFRQRPPELVLIDSGRQKRYFKRADFDYLEFLEEDARFAALWESCGYRRAGMVPDFLDRPFAVYVRAGAAVDREALRRLVE